MLFISFLGDVLQLCTKWQKQATIQAETADQEQNVNLVKMCKLASQ